MFKKILLSLILCSSITQAYVPLVKTVKTNLINPADITMDSQNQLFFISNKNGENNRKNNRGFISRLKITGKTISNQVIIKGGEQDVVLHAPKGILYRDQKLYVTDIDTVRIFKRETSGWVTEKSIPIRGAKYLNKLAIDSKGNLWVSDTGAKTILRLSPPYGKSFPRRYFFDKIPTPTGICIDKNNPDTLWITSYTSSYIYEASLSKNKVIKKYQTRARSLGSLFPIAENQIVSTNQETGQALIFTISNEVITRKPINEKPVQAPGGVLWDSVNDFFLITDTVKGEILIYQKTALPKTTTEK
ncbi:MAG: SMP-30/gluconolactonase/LRE family protein [Lentisphaeria bacterium]|nr:SMP-30/gluconolactonase/LRE family protein [Lentisphaeria bacterium]